MGLIHITGKEGKWCCSELLVIESLGHYWSDSKILLLAVGAVEQVSMRAKIKIAGKMPAFL